VDLRLLIVELFEKLSLIATAGLLGVLVPPLRNRLLGVGRPRDIAVVVIFGLLFSLWGSTMGFQWLGHFLNLRAIGIMIAGILGGPRAGALTGLLGGGFYVMRVVPEEFPWAVVASVLDGWLAGRMSVRREQMFVGWRVLGAAALVQLAGLMVTGAGMAFSGANPIEALPSLAAQLGGVAVGVALFVNVALVVISRQEQAVALVEAQAAANALSLTAPFAYCLAQPPRAPFLVQHAQHVARHHSARSRTSANARIGSGRPLPVSPAPPARCIPDERGRACLCLPSD